MAPWVKDLALALQQLWLLLWHRFDPWPGNLHAVGMAKKEKKERMKCIKDLIWTFLWKFISESTFPIWLHPSLYGNAMGSNLSHS